jgi:peptidoglycan/LPS O-acetylase OafA/YrhL
MYFRPLLKKQQKIVAQIRTWYRQMDGLRFIAIALVAIAHFAVGIGRPIHAGYFGVDLFFVLSGFLITEGLLLEKDKAQSRWGIIRLFYLKRFLRIFPIYYLVLFITFLTYPLFKEFWLYALTFTVNFFSKYCGDERLGAFSHLWSLSAEEQFYLFWPFLMIFVRGRKATFFAIFTLMLASMIYFVAAKEFYMLSGRMFSFCFGAGLAYIKLYHPGVYSGRINTTFFSIILLAVIVMYFHPHLGLSILSLALVYMASNNGFAGPFRWLVENKTSVYIGKISYGIYLYHMPIGVLISELYFQTAWKNTDFSFMPILKYNPWVVELPLYSLLSIGVAHLSYVYIEAPLLKLKSRLK